MQGREHHSEPSRTWLSIGFLVAFGAGLAAVGADAAEPVRTSALSPETDEAWEDILPTPLATVEAERYRRIFALQAEGLWAEADRELAALKDKLLLGAVRAQRYRHHAYRAGYDELAAWLARHAEEPDAKAIHALALRRKPQGIKAPQFPKPIAASDAASLPDTTEAETSLAATLLPPRRLALDPAPSAGELRHQLSALATNEPRRAELILEGPDARRLLGRAEINAFRAAISEGYLARGEARAALALSADSPLAHWQAGLAAWRLNRLSEAGAHFQAATRAPGQSRERIAAAAFWAARVERRNRQPQLVKYWLGIAAQQPRTLYGLLARRTLAIETPLEFGADPFTAGDGERLLATGGGRRALALLQVGESGRAEEELRLLAATATTDFIRSLLALADRANMPALSLRLAGRLADADGRHHDHALYPVPRWTPRGGFSVDRALLFALMRQESKFLPTAQSQAGALGLMQLMPATARAMAERTGVALGEPHRRDSALLAEPELNLALAQEYVSLLLRDEHVHGNLLLLLVAYNGGPGTLRHALDAPELRQDPLLFLESLASQETRLFAERVLTNYWIYRLRLGQASPDLAALAAGEWPTYIALDRSQEPGLRHAENR